MHNGGVFSAELLEDIKHEQQFRVFLENLHKYKNKKDQRELTFLFGYSWMQVPSPIAFYKDAKTGLKQNSISVREHSVFKRGEFVKMSSASVLCPLFRWMRM